MITEQMTAVAASSVNEQLRAVSPSVAAFKGELETGEGSGTPTVFLRAGAGVSNCAASCASATYSS